MSKKVFESLAQSLREAGKIERGEIKPSREFVYNRPTAKSKPEKHLAICVNTDDAELLIPGKVYEVELLGNRYAVRDEEDEITLCPQEFFVLVTFESTFEKRLRQIVTTH